MIGKLFSKCTEIYTLDSLKKEKKRLNVRQRYGSDGAELFMGI